MRRDRERCSLECSDLKVRVAMGAAETATLKAVVEELRAELGRLDAQLRVTKEQLEWWPRPLTRYRVLRPSFNLGYAKGLGTLSLA